MKRGAKKREKNRKNIFVLVALVSEFANELWGITVRSGENSNRLGLSDQIVTMVKEVRSNHEVMEALVEVTEKFLYMVANLPDSILDMSIDKDFWYKAKETIRYRTREVIRDRWQAGGGEGFLMKTAMDLDQWLSVHRKLPYVAFPGKSC